MRNVCVTLLASRVLLNNPQPKNIIMFTKNTYRNTALLTSNVNLISLKFLNF